MPDTDGREGSGQGSPPVRAGTRPRFALPGDLPGALRHLEDAQLDDLLRAAQAEARRRGWKAGQAAPPRREAKPTPTRARAKAGRRPAALTPGQERIVRAALEAGVGPAAIARQFGVPRAQVQRIAAELKGRK